MTATDPLRLCLGLHLHQPVGNFDHVFRDHLDAVYRPLLDGLAGGGITPVAMHLSGPLLDWLESRAADWVDRLGRAVEQGDIELLAAGHDEPILVALSPEDRVEQVARHRERLWRRFGTDVTGLWLTERVWEPDLPRDLAAAGIRSVIVDDRHLRLTGLPPEAIHRPWVTEYAGSRVTVLGIDERLRYLVPFRPVEELGEYLRALHADGHHLAVLADDGEKFGGWPGTAAWVWEEGWFDRFAARLRHLSEDGTIVLSRFGDAIEAVEAAGPVYLPSASYRELERWALPAGRARALERLEEAGEIDPVMLRGGHWRHFLAKYPEVNRLHKSVAWFSRRCRGAGDDPVVRRHLGRAQCNDAYWHGVFGGAYLPFLRAALWRELATAARGLHGEAPPLVVVEDLDADGHDEVVILSAAAFTVIAPHRGGTVEVHLDLEGGVNLCDVMARHEEAYHPVMAADTPAVPADDGTGTAGSADGGMPSIHDLETTLATRPALDAEPRALFVDRWLDEETTGEMFAAGTVPISLHGPQRCTVDAGDSAVTVRLAGPGITKLLRVRPDGSIELEWRWSAEVAGGAWFSSELSCPTPPRIEAPGAGRWEYPVATVSKSEKGFDHTHQGTAVVLRWPSSVGAARAVLAPPPGFAG